MVRKWSYIKTSVLLKPKTTVSYTTKLHVYKVFRFTTRFKKFNIGYTRFTRNLYRRRKHKLNWIGMVGIVEYWVRNYLKYKQIVRFIQSTNLFKLLMPYISPLVYKSYIWNLNKYNFIFFTSVSKKLLLNFQYNSLTCHYSLHSQFYSNSQDQFTQSKLDNFRPSLITFDNLHYSTLGDKSNLLCKSKKLSYILGTERFIFNYIVTFYKILIQLTLLNILK